MEEKIIDVLDHYWFSRICKKEAVERLLNLHSVMCSVKSSDLKSLDYEEEYYEHFECPKCKSSIEMANFCSNCGVKIVD